MWKDITFIIGLSHDLGKAKTKFQKRLIEQSGKHVEHSLLSSFFTYFLLKKYFSKCGKTDEYWTKLTLTAATLAVASHHSRLCDLSRGEKLGEGLFLVSRYGKEREYEKRFDLKWEMHDMLRNPQLPSLVKIIDSVLEMVCGLEKPLASIIEDLRSGLFDEMADQLVNTIKEVHQALKFSSEPNLNFYFLTIYLYSILTDADVLNACGFSKPVPRSKYRKHLTPKLIETYLKSVKFAEKRQLPLAPLRNQILRETKKTIKQLDLKRHRMLALTVPTGLGKTLSALYAGLEIRCREPVKGEPRRIIYAAPFLSIVDQTADQVQKILMQINPEPAADLMLVHHHLADIKYPIKEVSEEKPSSYGELLLFESWNSEIILTTFSQLLESLVNNRRGAIRKIHRIPHSIILLDEIQAIPIELWELVDKIFNFLIENWDCYIIFLTATMPKIIKRRLTPLVAKRNFKLNRYIVEVDLDFNFSPEFEFSQFKKEVADTIKKNPDQNIMIIVNTIGNSKELYSFLTRHFQAKKLKDGTARAEKTVFINLSTHLTPHDRHKRLKKIERLIKRKLAGKNTSRLVVVTTQLVEAGVDLDVDLIIRDFAPLDCLIQAAGRCNRHNAAPHGKIKIVYLHQNRRKFAPKIYSPALLHKTEDVLKQVGPKTSSSPQRIKFATSEQNITTQKLLDMYFSKIDTVPIWVNRLERAEFNSLSNFTLFPQKELNLIVFVEQNKTAKTIKTQIIKTIAKLKKATSKNRWTLLTNLRKYWRRANHYLINIRFPPEEVAALPPLIPSRETLKTIQLEHLQRNYDPQTGFIFTPPENIF